MDVNEAAVELLNAFDKSLKESTGKTMSEIVKTGVTSGWHVLPADPPEPGADVLLQYRTKTGDVRRAVSTWTGKYWSGRYAFPQAWHELPEPYRID